MKVCTLFVLVGLGCVGVYCGATSAVPLLTNYSAIVPPVKDLAQCLPRALSDTELQDVRIGILLADGASFYDTTMSRQFFKNRGATVEFLCPFSRTVAGQVENEVVLLEDYLPRATVSCTAGAANTTLMSKLATFQVLLVPSGYASIETLRGSAGSILVEFLDIPTASDSLVNQTVVLVGGAAELLIGSTVSSPLLSARFTTDAKWQIPSGASPELADFLGKKELQEDGSAVHLVDNPSEFNVSDISLFGSSSNTSSSLVVALNSTYIRKALISAVKKSVTDCDDLLAVDGSVFSSIDQETYPSFIATRNATSNLGSSLKTMVLRPSQMSDLCFNRAGVDFCNGWEFGLVVSHGSHDLEVIAALTSLSQNGANVNVYCPPSVRTSATPGFVYLMPEPPDFPTYTLQCDYFLDQWAFVGKGLSGTIVVPHGVIATHGTLRLSNDLRNALALTETFSLYGSAMILLTLSDIDDDMKTVPSCPVTNLDLTVVQDFHVAPNSSAQTFRQGSVKHTKVLAGFEDMETVTVNFDDFLAKSVEGLVWESETMHLQDVVIGALFLSSTAGLVAVVVLAVCRRSRRLARRDGYHSTSRHLDGSQK